MPRTILWWLTTFVWIAYVICNNRINVHHSPVNAISE